MATRTAFPGTITTSTPISATNNNRLPGGWVAYVELASDVGSITTEQDVTGLQEDVTLVAGRRYKVTAVVHTTAGGTNADRDISLDDGASRVQIHRTHPPATGINTHTLTAVIDGDGNSHDLQVRAAWSGTGSMIVESAPAAGFPSFLLVEDVGPSS